MRSQLEPVPSTFTLTTCTHYCTANSVYLRRVKALAIFLLIINTCLLIETTRLKNRGNLGAPFLSKFQSLIKLTSRYHYIIPLGFWGFGELKSELKKPTGVPVVMVYDKSGLLVQYEKGQMFAEDVQALSRWI